MVERDLAWFLSESVLTPAQGRAVMAAARARCHELGPQARARATDCPRVSSSRGEEGSGG